MRNDDGSTEGKTYVYIDSWAGRSRVLVEIVGETPKLYRVRLLEDGALPKRRLKAGEITTVPKYAVRSEQHGR